MDTKKTAATAQKNSAKDFWLLLGVLAVIMAGLFHKSLAHAFVVHNNDSPYGAVCQAACDLPQAFTGVWADLNWLGVESTSAAPDASTFFRWFGGNLSYAKFLTPVSQMLLGLCAWAFFRALKLSPFACVLGGLAAALHSDFFSNACWGQHSRPLALSAMLLALAAVQARGGWRGWARVLLAGFSVGVGVMEGFDIAALLSVVVGVYVLVQPWVEDDGSPGKKVFTGVSRAALLAGFSGLVAAQSVVGLVSTQIQGVAGASQDSESKAAKWDWATQWSMPKVETLGLIVPGLFGYRMDTPQGLPEDMQKSYEGGQYWGAGGRDASWETYFDSGKTAAQGHGFIRHSGGGCYAGPVLMMVSLMALLQSLRGRFSPFTPAQRRWVWFWAACAACALPMAWGRHAPFFKPFYYLLPFANAVRNPVKFLHIWDMSMLVLFGYGVHAIAKSHLTAQPAAAKNKWPAGAPEFDRKWVAGAMAAMFLGGLAWLIYASNDAPLRKYLEYVQFDSNSAAAIARFSISRVAWFVFFLVLGLGTLIAMVRGKFTGPRAKWGAALLGAALVLDLAHANRAWIIYWDFPKKYATNDLLETLREHPNEQRVVGLPSWVMEAFQFDDRLRGAEQYLDQLYRVEWAQHHFQRFDIQSLDIVQMSRPPEDFMAYEAALAVRSGETLPLLTRKWELTNTRYILAHSFFAEFLNKQFDPGKERFRIAQHFDIAPKPGVANVHLLEDLTAVTNATGGFALIEFTGALPRAKLYTDWQSGVADTNALTTLANLHFDPAQKVLVAETLPAAAPATNAAAGTVTFAGYETKHITLKASASAPSVLLLNDRYSPSWQVRVDGQPAKLLRCNYLMRGVSLTAGQHTVEFIFAPGVRPLYITCAAMGFGLMVALALLFTMRRTVETAA